MIILLNIYPKGFEYSTKKFTCLILKNDCRNFVVHTLKLECTQTNDFNNLWIHQEQQPTNNK